MRSCPNPEQLPIAPPLSRVLHRCGLCEDAPGFAHLSELREHVARVHMRGEEVEEEERSRRRKKECNICSKLFADSKCLKKHVQVGMRLKVGGDCD